MATEAQLIVERATLRWLAQQHPDWTQPELARYLSKSVDWVKKWLKRFRQADPNDVTVLHARSRARKTPPASLAEQPVLVQRILEIREAPPENLQRTPGPEAILYYLHRDPLFQAAGVRLPRATFAESSKFCGSLAVLHTIAPVSTSHGTQEHPGKRCNSISRIS